MKKRFIFDLDGTLLQGDFRREKEYFRSMLSDLDADKFISSYFEKLLEYESLYKKYDVLNLSRFLSDELKLNIEPELIYGWIDVNSTMNDKLLPETKCMLEYLKSKGMSLVVLTNWFKYTQEQRLKNSGILLYFDEVFTGDMFLKPNEESYLAACGNYDVSECVMIGDTIEKDVLGPKKFGIDSIYYNPENKEYEKEKILSISSFDKIREMF